MPKHVPLKCVLWMSKIGTLNSKTRKWMLPTICFSLNALGFSGRWLSEGHFVFFVSLTLSLRREWDLDIQEKMLAVRRAFSLVMRKITKCLLSCLRGFHVVSSAGSSYFPIILFKQAGPGKKKKNDRSCYKLLCRTKQRPTTPQQERSGLGVLLPWKHSWTLTSTFWDIPFPFFFCQLLVHSC